MPADSSQVEGGNGAQKHPNSPSMKKIDLKKDLKALYSQPANKITMVDVPRLQCLMIDGQGDPNTSEAFQAAINALYTVCYTLKFSLKKGPEAIDFGVMPLEALWWSDDMADFAAGHKDKWKWTAMIVLPDFVTAEMVQQTIQEAAKKKDLPALARLRFEAFEEGKSAQILHVGPYSEERPNIERLHQWIADQGYALRGKHHEIYLGDPRRSAPEKLKTILRQPMGR
jgi:hypothetical protein